jgi:hypothetical protein
MEHNEKGSVGLSHNIYYADTRYLEGQAELAERARLINPLKRFSLKQESLKYAYKW